MYILKDLVSTKTPQKGDLFLSVQENNKAIINNTTIIKKTQPCLLHIYLWNNLYPIKYLTNLTFFLLKSDEMSSYNLFLQDIFSTDNI